MGGWTSTIGATGAPTLVGAAAALSVVLVALAAGEVRRWIGASWIAGRTGRSPVARQVPRPIAGALTSAGIDAVHHPVAVAAWGAGVVVASVFAGATASGPLLPAVAVAGPPAVVVASRGRSARLRRAQLPVVLETVVAGMRSGRSLLDAIADLSIGHGPVGVELGAVAAEASRGRRLDDALAAWAGTQPDPAGRFAGATLTVASEVGGPGADAIEAAAASLRERAALDDEVAALSVQARSSALLLSLAPIGFAILLAGLDPRSSRFLLGTPVGLACVALGLGLDALGAWWMHRLVRAAR